uniref:Uncharacterized protein n=1 Tax=Anopheles maculatus TaxID=74869 RepID=A0A182SAQ2_9DIPT
MEQHQNGTVNLNISLTVPIVLNYIEITVKTFYKYTTYRPFMIDWNIELCRAYHLGNINPSAVLVLKIIAETLPEYYYPCPHGNRTYVAAWLLDPKFIPETLPSAQYIKSPKKGRITHSLRITKMHCVDELSYKITTVNHCQMEQHGNGTMGLNISLTAPTVLNYIEVTVKLFYKYTTYRPFMIDWAIELCQTYRSGRFNPSAALVLKVIEESLPQYYYPCPHGNQTYIAVWHFDPKFIPEALPSGNYRLDVDFRDTKNALLLGIQVYGAVRRQGLVG